MATGASHVLLKRQKLCSTGGKGRAQQRWGDSGLLHASMQLHPLLLSSLAWLFTREKSPARAESEELSSHPWQYSQHGFVLGLYYWHQATAALCCSGVTEGQILEGDRELWLHVHILPETWWFLCLPIPPFPYPSLQCYFFSGSNPRITRPQILHFSSSVSISYPPYWSLMPMPLPGYTSVIQGSDRINWILQLWSMFSHDQSRSKYCSILYDAALFKYRKYGLQNLNQSVTKIMTIWRHVRFNHCLSNCQLNTSREAPYVPHL